eukprot:1035146-Rhodomonas_salina.1
MGGVAGAGDVLASASAELVRSFAAGQRLAQGQRPDLTDHHNQTLDNLKAPHAQVCPTQPGSQGKAGGLDLYILLIRRIGCECDWDQGGCASLKHFFEVVLTSVACRAQREWRQRRRCTRWRRARGSRCRSATWSTTCSTTAP